MKRNPPSDVVIAQHQQPAGAPWNHFLLLCKTFSISLPFLTVSAFLFIPTNQYLFGTKRIIIRISTAKRVNLLACPCYETIHLFWVVRQPRMVLVKLPGLHFSLEQSNLFLHWLQFQSTHNSLCLSNHSCLNELRSQFIFCCNSVQHLTLAQVLTGTYSSITPAFRSSRKVCPIVCVENENKKNQLPVIAWWNDLFLKLCIPFFKTGLLTNTWKPHTILNQCKQSGTVEVQNMKKK